MAHVAGLWRHPIKSHGREQLDEVTLITGQTMPWDRHWAVMHDKTKFDPEAPAWEHCRNFMIGATTPGLAGIWAEFDEGAGQMHLRHEALGNLSFDPENADDVARFVTWVSPLCPPDKFQPTGLAKASQRGMTDTDYASVSIMTHASHAAVSDALGAPLEMERWRGNIWLDGTTPWEEFNWVGQNVAIGGAVLQVIEPIKRCKHTMANPKTGTRDTDTLAALRNGWGHENFGVYAKVIKGGKVAINDTAKVI